MNAIQDTTTGKLLTIAAAFLIACGSVAALGAWADASVRTLPAAATDGIVTLPTITVRPTPEQLRELQRSSHDQTAALGGGGGGGVFDMPYYSFAVQPARD